MAGLRLPTKLVNFLSYFFIALFIAWLSFLPESIQYRFSLAVKISLAAALIFFLFFRGENFKEYFFSKYDRSLWIYLALLSFNVWFSEDVKNSLAFYRHFVITSTLIYFIFKNELKFLNIKIIFYIFAFCASLVAFLAFWEMLSRSNPIYQNWAKNDVFYLRFLGKRAVSTMSHPIVLGCYFVPILPFAYYLYKESPFGTIKRTVMWTTFVSLVAGLFLTLSRCSWFICFIMISLGLIFKRKIKFVIICWLIFLLIPTIAAHPVFENTEFYRLSFKRIKMHLRYGNRPVQYITTISILKKHPFLGVGLTRYRDVYYQYASRKLPWELKVPESIYLGHLAEAGLLGFLGLALFLINIFRNFWHNYFRQQEKGVKEHLQVIFISFVGLLLNLGWFDGFAWHTSLYLFWILTGLMAGISLYNNYKT